MNHDEILSTYIKKLSHPLREIRERSLQLLLTKLQFGWNLCDELTKCTELIQAILIWFNEHQPTMQREALQVLLIIIKSKSGSFAAKQYDTRKLIDNLKTLKPKIDINAQHIYEDIIEILQFLHTVESEENINVPRLNLPSVSSSESEIREFLYSKSNVQNSSEFYDDYKQYNQQNNKLKSSGINVFLLPWVLLSPSDNKTIALIEDSLKLVKSTRRSCRFVRDVLIYDFPAEIFLNRPSILNTLLSIADGQCGSSPGEALRALHSITVTLHKRLLQLFSPDLICENVQVEYHNKEYCDKVNAEFENVVGTTRSPVEDPLAALRQTPAPIYALNTCSHILSILLKSVMQFDADQIEILKMKEFNTCVCLVEALINFLLDCVNESFWSADHLTKSQRDIAHKTCMFMRMLGDLLLSFEQSYNLDPNRIHHRLAWIRLMMCAEKLMNWAKRSPLPPTTFINSLQNGVLDPGIDIFFPELNKAISLVLQNSKSFVDQDFKTRYRELQKLRTSMNYAVQFMKKRPKQNTNDLLLLIKNSLPVLEIHSNESFLTEMASVIITGTNDQHFDENDWSIARSIALILMSHNMEWVRVKFYRMLSDMVKSVLMGDESQQGNGEKCLTLICDVSILTEICCHGLSSSVKEVEESASDVILYLLRGRLVVSESCWWRLLASLLPVLPLLHVYVTHDTQLGKAICKSLEVDIAECLGIPTVDVTWGLVRLLFVRCAAVQLDAAHSLCCLLDDDRYLPPKETLRTDILINALRRVETQDFNIDQNFTTSNNSQSTGLIQILDVLKQDLILDEDSSEFVAAPRTSRPMLEPSLRRTTLQQLAVVLRHTDLHEMFLRNDGVKLVVALLRMSLTVDDYLAFPECGLSCVSILNSVCFVARHVLAKVADLPCFLIRGILVFPANETHVLMSCQVLSLAAWGGFALQEVDAARRRVPALPFAVTQRVSLPFAANSYWHTSPNAEHDSVEWLLNEDRWRTSIRVRWWWELTDGRTLRESPRLIQGNTIPCPPSTHELLVLRSACVDYSCAKLLLMLENATSHSQVNEALYLLESYVRLMPSSTVRPKEFDSLQWQNMKRFLSAPPASGRDTLLLTSLIQFVVVYMDSVPRDAPMLWINSAFIGKDATIISLLSRDKLYPQQTDAEDIDVIQLRIHVVKVMLRCIVMMEHNDVYSSRKMESLFKIVLTCLERVVLENFHILGYLNVLLRCVRYCLHCRYLVVSEEMLMYSMRVLTRLLTKCGSGLNGRKGEASRLDIILSLMALLNIARDTNVPVQRWSEYVDGDVVEAIVRCTEAPSRTEVRTGALHVVAALANYTQFLPHLMQYVPGEIISRYGVEVFMKSGEANSVRSAALVLLTAITFRLSQHNHILESEVLGAIEENNFVEECLQVLVDFCNNRNYKMVIEPNVPVPLLERNIELEVLSQKCNDVSLTPHHVVQKPPPTADLITSIADVFTNLVLFKSCPIQAWNERGLFRLMFRCATRSVGDMTEASLVCASVCRCLSVAATHKCVRTLLAATKDCLYHLLVTLKPLDFDEDDTASGRARASSMVLVAAVLGDKSASDTVCWEIKKTHSVPLFTLLLRSLVSSNEELKTAAFYFLTQLSQSISRKERTKRESYVDFIDNMKQTMNDKQKDLLSGGDRAENSDCQPEYIVEELCKLLIEQYKEQSNRKNYLDSQDEAWCAVSSCISSLLSISPRTRLYAVHRHFPQILLNTLQTVRDKLSLHGKPADVIRNANNEPVLQNLCWILTIMNSLMLDCIHAKESFAEDNIATSLNKLWPWCMMTEQLREALIKLLLTFTNECTKAWSCMCVCVGGRSMAVEACALVCRDASRLKTSPLLPLALRLLTNCVSHQHCRAIILKSDVMSWLSKLRARSNPNTQAYTAWMKLCEKIARYQDGAGALLTVVASPNMRPIPHRLLPAIAHAAHHHRLTFLQSPDILELLCGSLLTGDTGEAVCAARAVWALAANNHRAKLVLRSAGVTAAVHSTLVRLQRSSEAEVHRALQLLTYTHNILQAT